MPMKLNVGLTKKVGLPDYGSVGACCHVELELDQNMLHADPTGFQRQAEQTFASCRQAVEAELARQRAPDVRNQPDAAASNGQHSPKPANGRSATSSQVRAIHAIASRQGVDLAAELRKQFGVARPEDLDIKQASHFIDHLKAATNGAGGRR